MVKHCEYGSIGNDKYQRNYKTNIDYWSIETKELLTINETCALLNITHVTVRRWLKNNILTSSRIGKKHLIKRAEIYQLL